MLIMPFIYPMIRRERFGGMGIFFFVFYGEPLGATKSLRVSPTTFQLFAESGRSAWIDGVVAASWVLGICGVSTETSPRRIVGKCVTCVCASCFHHRHHHPQPYHTLFSLTHTHCLGPLAGICFSGKKKHIFGFVQVCEGFFFFFMASAQEEAAAKSSAAEEFGTRTVPVWFS